MRNGERRSSRKGVTTDSLGHRGKLRWALLLFVPFQSADPNLRSLNTFLDQPFSSVITLLNIFDVL